MSCAPLASAASCSASRIHQLARRYVLGPATSGTLADEPEAVARANPATDGKPGHGDLAFSGDPATGLPWTTQQVMGIIVDFFGEHLK
jgi:hypothetical protein